MYDVFEAPNYETVHYYLRRSLSLLEDGEPKNLKEAKSYIVKAIDEIEDHIELTDEEVEEILLEEETV